MCVSDDECNLGDNAGYCASPGFCAFDDPACPSGRRYGAFAGMGLADECVPGNAGSTEASSGEASGSTHAGSTDAADSTTTSTVTTTDTTAPSASESSTGPDDPAEICTTHTFDEDPMFEDLGVFIEVFTDAGRLLGVWGPSDRGSSAALGVDEALNVSSGSTEIELADFPGAQGTLVALQWEDAAGRQLFATVDGPQFVIGLNDPADPEPVFLATENHGGRTLLRIRAELGKVSVDAGGVEGFNTLTEVEQPFDTSSVDVALFFNRYDATNRATLVSLESLTSCHLE